MTITPTGELDERINAAMDKLDLPAKVRLLTGAAMFSLHAEPAIELDELRLSDGPTGVRGDDFIDGEIVSLLPNASLLAQHWDERVAGSVGSILADEALAQRIHVVLGPTINLHRSPIGGRLFEAYSEDPLLTGKLAVSYVLALQDKGIGATVKHFLANESEKERASVNSLVDERTLRELYLFPFQLVVDEANPWAVMASYNRINGVTATEHTSLVEGVLKGEWGYDGLVMSDWHATRSTVASANGGLDLAMPGPNGPWGERLVEAVQSGAVAESAIDDHLRRLLRLADRVGAFGTQREWTTGLPAPDCAERRRALRELSAGGMAVLVNKDSTLPLSPTQSGVAVIGRHAVESIAQGGGSAKVRAPHVVSIADGLVDALGADRVEVVDGVEVRSRPVAPARGVLRDPEDGTSGMRVIGKTSEGEILGSVHVDAPELIIGFGSFEWATDADVLELTADIDVDAPTRMQVGLRGLGDWTFHAGGETHTVAHAGGNDPGEGILTPPGWVTEVHVDSTVRITATARVQDEITLYGLVARRAPSAPAEAVSNAVRAARNAEVAVVAVGLTEEQETEGADKTTLALPGEQDTLVAAVAGVAQRTIVVVNAATPVLMPWLSQVDAVLFAGLPGQEAGAAVAAALLGEIEPAGRLVTTFPAADGAGPAWSTTPQDGSLPYTEGTAIGYRGWDADRSVEPLFWFGHGLGYTTWEYSDAEVRSAKSLVSSVKVTVTNIGDRAGKEVVQAYLRPAAEDEPTRLIGWASAHVEAGSSATVEVACNQRVQQRWDEETGEWSELPCAAEVVLARGLGDIRVNLPAW